MSNNCSIFSNSPPSFSAPIPHTFACLQIDWLLCCFVLFLWPLVALPFHPEVKTTPACWPDTCVQPWPWFWPLWRLNQFRRPPTPQPIAEVFVRVLVEFGRVWTAIWRLPAMGGVVDVSISLAKMARKERWVQKIKVRTNGVQNHHWRIKSTGTQIKVRCFHFDLIPS